MSDVINFPNGKAPPKVLFNHLLETKELDTVLVLAWDKEGKFTLAGNSNELKQIAWLLKQADTWLNDAINGVHDE